MHDSSLVAQLHQHGALVPHLLLGAGQQMGEGCPDAGPRGGAGGCPSWLLREGGLDGEVEAARADVPFQTRGGAAKPPRHLLPQAAGQLSWCAVEQLDGQADCCVAGDVCLLKQAARLSRCSLAAGQIIACKCRRHSGSIPAGEGGCVKSRGWCELLRL